jgi:aminobenzoyl-glutamate utilization protein B
VAAGGTTIGEQGLHLAARTLALSAADLFRSEELRTEAASEFRRRLGDTKYESLLEPGQQPPLDYRNDPTANR